VTQDKTVFEHVITGVVQYFTTALRKMDTVLDSGDEICSGCRAAKKEA
jgi:hypothetical protein